MMSLPALHHFDGIGNECLALIVPEEPGQRLRLAPGRLLWFTIQRVNEPDREQAEDRCPLLACQLKMTLSSLWAMRSVAARMCFGTSCTLPPH